MVTIDGKEFNLEPTNLDLPGWEVEINGETVTDVRTLTAINRQMGLGFLYGRSPAGPYNQGRLVNRGGAVIATTIQHDSKWYFLAHRQIRPLLSPDAILEFPRGQAVADESAMETARRQFLEEIGIDIPIDAFQFLGWGNPDSALIHGTPIQAWWLNLPSRYVVVEDGILVIKPEQEMETRTKAWENILKSEVVSEDEFESPSMMTDWAAGKVRRKIRQLEIQAMGPMPRP